MNYNEEMRKQKRDKAREDWKSMYNERTDKNTETGFQCTKRKSNAS